MDFKLFLDIIKVILGILIGFGFSITAATQFSYKKFPMNKRERFWRSVLVGLSIPVSVFSILLVADVFYGENLFSFLVVGALLCPTIPTTVFVFFTVNSRLKRMEKKAIEYSEFKEKSTYFKNRFD